MTRRWMNFDGSDADFNAGGRRKTDAVVPVIGGRIETLSNLKDSVEDLKVNSEDEVSLLDADITQLAIDLARHQMLYEMSLTAAYKIFSTSLLDFLGEKGFANANGLANFLC